MEPLDPEVRALIDRGLGAAWPSSAVEARSLDRLLEKIAADPGDGGDDGDDGGGGDESPGGGGVDGGGVDASIDPGAAIATTKAGGLASAVHAVVIVGLITAGAAAISALAGGPRSTPTAPIADGSGAARPVLKDSSEGVDDGGDQAVLEDKSQDLPERSTAAASEPEPAAPRPRPRPSATAKTEPEPASEPLPPVDLRGVDPLVAETRLVAEAEAALARGEPARARDLARDLARAFPEGQLTLEREAIELCARCGLGEPGAGRNARAFLSAHADAPVAARVRARCESTLKSSGE